MTSFISPFLLRDHIRILPPRRWLYDTAVCALTGDGCFLPLPPYPRTGAELLGQRSAGGADAVRKQNATV
jgi:hypothetical protein